jgi:hypothetical protein
MSLLNDPISKRHDTLSRLKAAEEQMNNILLAYTQRGRHDADLHQDLIEALKTATTEFLELRRRFYLGLGLSQ